MRQGLLPTARKTVGGLGNSAILFTTSGPLALIYRAYSEVSEPVGEESSPGVFPRLRSRRDLRVWAQLRVVVGAVTVGTLSASLIECE
jgi:hypothetical protein